jgi:DNA repair exonuclease SbcCD ATPase subunit
MSSSGNSNGSNPHENSNGSNPNENSNGSNPPEKKLDAFLRNVEGLEKYIERLEEDIDIFRYMNTEQKEKIEKLKEEITELASIFNDDKKWLNKEIRRLKDKVKDNNEWAETRLNNCRITIQELSEKKSGLDSENQRLKVENEELKKKLAKMLQAEAERLEEEKKEKECTLCLDTEIEVKTKCGHSFCRTCIDNWIDQQGKHTCPNCRAPVSQESLEPIGKPKVGGGRVQDSPSSSCGGSCSVQEQSEQGPPRGGRNGDRYSQLPARDSPRTMGDIIMQNGGY